MNRSNFLTHFLFGLPIGQQIQQTVHSGARKAAVLIALVERVNGLHIILTKRAAHLRHHPGQVSFPGGKHENSDLSLAHTALRETAEEIGIGEDYVELIGALPSINTNSGFQVFPFVALIRPSFTLNIDTEEVSEVFELPLHFLLNDDNIHLQHLLANKKRHYSYCIAYQNQFIWGATAQMLKNLQGMLKQQSL